MSFKSSLLLILLLFIGRMAKSQTENDQIVEIIVESVAEAAGEDFDYSELTERLNFYRQNPININKTDREKLQELMFISPLQINQILEHRYTNGSFLELYELQSITALDLETIKKLLPFISLGESNALKDITFKNLIQKGNNDLMFTLGQTIEKQQGYLNSQNEEPKSAYLGSSQRFLTRYRYHYGENLAVALTMEKDPGEPFLSGSNRSGFDFYSGSIFFKNVGKVRKLAVGDYSLQFGQGLTMWSGLSFSKGAAIAAIAKNEIGLKQYSSTNEALFLRGLASTIQLKKVEITPFVSYRALDAGLSVNEESGALEVSSLTQTGLHRTANEVSDQKSINQLVYGSNLQYAVRSLRIGAIAYQTQFTKSFEAGNQPYNSYDFKDDNLTNIGAYYNYSWRNFYLFGEAAHSLGSGSAFLNGLMASLTPQVALITFHRNYQKDYHSFFNQAVAEGSNAVNEKGFYTGLVITPGRKYELSLYADYFKFPWMRFRADAPSNGFELLAQLSYSPNKRFKTILRFKQENKEENDALENAMNFLEDVQKRNYRLEVSYKVNDWLQMRNRAEAITYQKGTSPREIGFVLFQDVNYNPKSKFSGNFRLALFNTDSFNARIYAYESDVLYGYSAPAYQNKGLRFYVNGRYRINRQMDAWIRYALTSYSDLEEIGSGLDRIGGNNKSDFKLQLRIQF